ncbi:hypothetical protein [Streptomyces sp. NPDC092370]|uniref:hypothetical protein n=1 Tax=Streptomyces sp. NPDC092370 TaxID=3366016 RepID=UPI00381AC3FD
MPAIDSMPGRRPPRATTAVALIALAGCGSGASDTKASGTARDAKSAAAGASPDSGDASRAAALVHRAIDATFDQEYLRSTRRTKTEGTTTLRIAPGGGRAACEARSRKGSASLDFIVTASALYSRGSKEALELSPEGKADPVRVKVMADRWVKRGAAVSEAAGEMCEATTRRTWLEERIPSLGRLAEEKPRQQSVKVRERSATKITYERAGGPLEFCIAAEGSPLLLRVTYPATDLDESFSDFGKPFRVVAPSGAVSELRMAREVLAAQ